MSNAEPKEAVMLNRVSALSLVLGLVAGYAARGTDVTAQSQLAGAPLTVGDKVTLVFPEVDYDHTPPSRSCTVLELYGSYVRCEPQTRTFGDPVNVDWINVSQARQIRKHSK
jgi:hypothetical protein